MLKDDKLSFIYNAGNNIARFISVSPENKIRHVWIDENYISSNDLKENIINLINLSSSKSVNIRSFSEESVKGNRFVYGKKLEDIDEIMQIINENCVDGKYSIINETIDINDGGVSGVIMGNIIEFSPNDTPRCVEKEGVCRLPLNVGLAILKTVYGFMPRHTFRPNHRIEFSIHPQMEGIMNWHTIIWEYEEFELMVREEQKGDKDINIASILSQNAVIPVYSGGAIITSKGITIEGVSGKGDEFMLGTDASEKLPIVLKKQLEFELSGLIELNNILGDVSVEWDKYIINSLSECFKNYIFLEENITKKFSDITYRITFYDGVIEKKGEDITITYDSTLEDVASDDGSLFDTLKKVLSEFKKDIVIYDGFNEYLYITDCNIIYKYNWYNDKLKIYDKDVNKNGC